VIRHSVKRPMKFEEAADGPSGLDLASRVQPGVIFLDLAMPGMHGGDVLEQLKADPATAQIPVIVITSQDVDSPTRARLAAHARAVLQKRDLSAELIARTLDSLERREPLQ
jgi:CheY-like chemotaxis protein